MRGGAIILLTILAGCIGAEPEPPTVIKDDPDLVVPPGRVLVVDAPDLPEGRSWTYTGVQEYNDDTEVTVVVMRVGSGGLRFAGAAEDDLVYDALWQNPLMGPRDADLNREGYPKLLDFPLEDGKTWAYSDGLMLTARAADVEGPGGPVPGFVIAGASERRAIMAEYAPSVGFLTRLAVVGADGTVFTDLRLARTEEGRSWMWHEIGDLVAVPASHEPQTFAVGAGFDEVIVSAGGTTGARAFVVPPGGQPWSIEFTGAEVWRHGRLPATPGQWGAAVAERPAPLAQAPVESPVGWAYMHVAPVRWLRAG